MAFSGSLNIFRLHSEANARVGERARINQNFTAPTQDVIVTADSSIESINMTGLPSLNLTQLLLGRATIAPPVAQYREDQNGNLKVNKLPAAVRSLDQMLPIVGSGTRVNTALEGAADAIGPAAPAGATEPATEPAAEPTPPSAIVTGYNLASTIFGQGGVGRTAKKDLFERIEAQIMPTRSTGSGLGINFQHTGYTNIATATIDDSALVSSQRNVRVESNTHNLMVDLTAAGAAAEGALALTGAGTWTDVNNRSNARVGDDAVIYAKSDINVDADTDNILVAYTGSTTHGADLGLGVSVNINAIENDVVAYVGDGPGAVEPVEVARDVLTFAGSGNTFTLTSTDQTAHDWMQDGLAVGDYIRIANLDPASDGVFRITSLSNTELGLEPLTGGQSPGMGAEGTVTITKMGRLQTAGVAVKLNLDDTAFYLSFALDDAGPDSIERSSGNWIDDGFTTGQLVTVEGSEHNDGRYRIDSIDEGKLYLTGVNLVEETSLAGVTVHGFAPSNELITTPAPPSLDFAVNTDGADTITRIEAGG